MPSIAGGAPNFLVEQATRLKVSPDLAYICRHCPELHKLGSLLGQLDGWLNDPHRPGKRRSLPEGEKPRILAALAQYELYHRKLHLKAAASDAMLNAAYAAFGLEPPDRPYELIAESDVKGWLPHGTPADVVDPPTPIAGVETNGVETAEQGPPIVETVVAEPSPIVEVERPAITPAIPAHKTPTPSLTHVKPAVAKHGNA